uniref:Transposase n=1 Tax=Acrobeloides nanus TaxID=290746 RepID=A0A914BXA6_9BILA
MNKKVRAPVLLNRFNNNSHRLLVFSDEKPFCIEQASNAQNDRIWSKEKPPTDQRVISRSLHPEWVHVWACITHRGKAPFVFIDPEVKINRWNYMERSLSRGPRKLLDGTMRQKSTKKSGLFNKIRPQATRPRRPKHGFAKTCWISSTPKNDRKAKACEKPHKSIKSLKKAIKKAWDEMSDEMVARVVDSWPGRLQACIDADGGYIE